MLSAGGLVRGAERQRFCSPSTVDGLAVVEAAVTITDCGFILDSIVLEFAALEYDCMTVVAGRELCGGSSTVPCCTGTGTNITGPLETEVGVEAANLLPLDNHPLKSGKHGNQGGGGPPLLVADGAESGCGGSKEVGGYGM